MEHLTYASYSVITMSSPAAARSKGKFVLSPLTKNLTADAFKRALVAMVNQADHKLRAMENALLRSLCAHHVCVEKHRVANAGGAYTAPTAQEIEAWKAPCTCLPGQVAPGAQLVCACGSDKTYSGAIADYEQAISRDQIKNSVSQASNPAGIKARTSDLKFKGTEMHQDFLAAILAQTDKLSFLKHCRELKAVDQFYSDFEVLDPDALALPHLWPLYDLLAEVFLTLSRPSSDHGANHFARFFEPPDPHKSLADYQSHIKPAVDYLQALQITDAAVLRDHLEAVSIINFITTCAHCKTSPKDISSAYLDVQRKIEAEQARDTTPITMQSLSHSKKSFA